MLDPAAQLILRGALALLFGWSATHKLRDVEGFRAALEGYDLLSPLWAVPAGAALIGAEVGVAVGLLLPRLAAAAALGAAALLALYAGAIAVNLRRGRRDIDCGCGGPAGRQPISGGLVVRNAVLAAAALASALPAYSRPLVWVDWLTTLGGIGVLTLLYAAMEQIRSIHHREARRITSRFAEHAEGRLRRPEPALNAERLGTRGSASQH